MADEKIITSSVFEQGITEIMQDIANNLYEFEEYTEEEVANLIDLSEEEVAELTRVINDTTVALNKVYSNKKVEDLLSELEVTCNKYADEKIGGLAGIHLAYVDTLPTTGEDNVIYILKSTTGGNDTLNLYNNGWVSIGEFKIDLDNNYYDKAEVDALLNDKANKNEVFSQNDVVSDMSSVSSSTVLSTAGLEVELNKKVDKDNIATVLDDTVTDDEVASAKVVVDELNTKANDDEVVKKTGIATTIDSTSTDDKVPSAKAVYDKFEETNVYKGKYEGDLNNIPFIKSGVVYKYDIRKEKCANMPISEHGILYSVYFDTNKFCLQEFHPLPSNKFSIYRRDKATGTWNNWKRLCDTSVEDVPFTTLTVNSWATGTVSYTVENGVCYLWISNIKSSTMDKGSQTIVSNLPLPKRGGLWYSIVSSDCTKGGLLVTVTTDGKLQNSTGLNNTSYFGSFSYPVAE